MFSTPQSDTNIIKYGQIRCKDDYSKIRFRCYRVTAFKSSNKLARYTYGNKSEKGIKIASWNKGKGHLKTKIHDIENIVSGLQPHILGITEADFHHNQDRHDVQLEDYTFITTKTLENENLKISRVVVYVHKSITFKVRHDLMDENTSSIWLEVGLPHKRKFLVSHYYREWQYLNQVDNSSRNINGRTI